MPKKIIDLTVALEDNPSEPIPVKLVTLEEHGRGADRLGRRLIWAKNGSLLATLGNLWAYWAGKRRLSRQSFPDGHFINNEQVTASVHAGSHLDAPSHFGTICEGTRPRSIDEIPLEWCYGPGVVLDLTHKGPGEFISSGDIEKSLDSIGYAVSPGDIVLIRTDADKLWGQPAYFSAYPGMSGEATAWLVERGVKVMGIDAFGFDRPFGAMLKDFFRTGDNRFLWPAHVYGRRKEYVHLERLANLDKLPAAFGFTVACFPVKITGASAAWTRVVAIVEEP